MLPTPYAKGLKRSWGRLLGGLSTKAGFGLWKRSWGNVGGLNAALRSGVVGLNCDFHPVGLLDIAHKGLEDVVLEEYFVEDPYTVFAGQSDHRAIVGRVEPIA